MHEESVASAADDTADRLAKVGADPRVYVVPEARLVFVALNKNACTSLKWMTAAIAGEDLTGFKAGLRTYTTDHEAVHNRSLWRRALTMNRVDPQVRATIDPAQGWFIFGVVRDPRGRLFSAWQNKLLLENAGYTQWRDQPWYPRTSFDAEAVRASFAGFVDALDGDPRHPLLMKDNHFKSQTRLLLLNKIRYSRIYDITEMGTLRSELQAHLASVGMSSGLLLPQANDTPLRTNAAVFADGVREKIERIYADDFTRFGDRWDFAAITAAAPWTEAALAEAELRATLGRRISELRDRASALRDEVAAERARADDLQKQLDSRATAPTHDAPAKTRSVLSRLRRRLVARPGKQ